MTTIEFKTELLSLEQSLERFAYRLTSEKDDAKDLVQDTILKVLMNQEKYINHVNFKAWTFTIMKNTFINNYKRRSRQSTYYDRTMASSSINQTKSSRSDDPDSVYSVLEITQNINHLKDKLRLPFKMHVDGYKYQEIAEELNLNIGTVKSRIFLSRKQLMNKLSD